MSAARIVLAWELGSGFGHLLPYRALVNALMERGHEVTVVVKDLGIAARVFADPAPQLMQGPQRMRTARGHIPDAASHAELLLSVGFTDPLVLGGHLRAWRALLEMLSPELVIFDHSPFALLAARGLRLRRVVSGVPFVVPPATTPWPPTRTGVAITAQRVQEAENRLLAALCRADAAGGGRGLERCADLYAADAAWVLSFADFDLYRSADRVYLGAYPEAGYGAPLRWPGDGKLRVFVYVSPFRALPALLSGLGRLDASTIVYGPQLPAHWRSGFTSAHMTVTAEPLDLASIGGASVAITMGNHGTTIQALLAGVPTLMLPTHMEWAALARCVSRTGAGISQTDLNDTISMVDAVKRLDRAPQYRTAARALARRHAERSAAERLANMLRDVEGLLGG